MLLGVVITPMISRAAGLRLVSPVKRLLMTAPSDWFAADGLQFTCSQCGNCCSGEPGFVHFTSAEGERMAARLGLDVATFYERHTREQDGAILLREKPSPSREGLDCALLERDANGKGVCTVYADRPTQCKTWPFWPENLASRSQWEQAKSSTPCAGMDNGQLHDAVEIRAIAAQDATATRLIQEEAVERIWSERRAKARTD